MSGPSCPSKTICPHSDWLLAFEVVREAVLFTLPHRAREFFGYCEFIISQFATFGDSSNHFHVVNLYQAIRLWVAQSNDLSLMSYDQFGDLVTHHVVIRGGGLAPSCLLTGSSTKHF